MPIDVTATATIARPRDEVAAYVADPAHDLSWIRALTASTQLTEGEVGVGTRVERVARMLGRRMPYTTEITAFEPAAHVAMQTVAGPFPMLVDYHFEDAGDGATRVRVRNRGGQGVLFTLFGWAIGRMVNRRVQGDLAQLKRILETR
jgi:uncharacterized protein YndB with AHSA1/START domain